MNIELPKKSLVFALTALGIYYLINSAIIAVDFVMMLGFRMPHAY